MGWEDQVARRLEQHPQVNFYLGGTNPQPSRPLIERVASFSIRTSLSLTTDFWTFLEKHQQKTGPIDPKITDHIMRKQLDTSRFDVFDEAASREVFELIDFEGTRIEPSSLLLVFNLPKPVAHFYRKGGDKAGNRAGIPLGPDLLPWGLFYVKLQSKFWEYADGAANDLDLERINGFQEHDPRHYYYLFEVSLATNPAPKKRRGHKRFRR